MERGVRERHSGFEGRKMGGWANLREREKESDGEKSGSGG